MSSSTPHDEYDNKGRQKVKCQECGLWYHRVDVHLQKKHPEFAGTDGKCKKYLDKYPGALLISDAASKHVKKTEAKKVAHEVKTAEAKAEAFEPSEGDFRIGVARLKQRDDLEESDRPHIPTHDPHFIIGTAEKERWEYIALGIQEQENTLIVGPTGCGKSEAVLQLAAVIDQPVQRLNLHGEVRAADFVGDKTVEVDPDTKQAVVMWQDGILPDAMRKGHWLLLDELDAAPAHVLFVLQAVLEKGMRLTLAANNGEVVRAHKHFRIIATANTLGRGDDTGLYNGTNILNEAFLDRFGIVIQSGYPNPSTENTILKERTGINVDDASRMIKVAGDVRKALETETVYCSFSTRRLIKWAQATVRLGDVKRALRISVTNRLSAEDSTFIDGLVQRYWG